MDGPLQGHPDILQVGKLPQEVGDLLLDLVNVAPPYLEGHHDRGQYRNTEEADEDLEGVLGNESGKGPVPEQDRNAQREESPEPCTETVISDVVAERMAEDLLDPDRQLGGLHLPGKARRCPLPSIGQGNPGLVLGLRDLPPGDLQPLGRENQGEDPDHCYRPDGEPDVEEDHEGRELALPGHGLGRGHDDHRDGGSHERSHVDLGHDLQGL